MGRYAYANQPRIALWNLTRLAECLLPLFSDDQDKAVAEAQSVLIGVRRRLQRRLSGGLARQARPVHRARRRPGPGAGPAGRDGQEPGRLHPRPSAAFSDCRAGTRPTTDRSRCASCSPTPTAFDEWAVRWRQRIADEPQSAAERQAAMRAVNPAFIPRNHRVEAVIEAAVNRRRFRARSRSCWRCCRSPMRTSRLCRLCRAAAAATSACCRPSAALNPANVPLNIPSGAGGSAAGINKGSMRSLQV